MCVCESVCVCVCVCVCECVCVCVCVSVCVSVFWSVLGNFTKTPYNPDFNNKLIALTFEQPQIIKVYISCTMIKYAAPLIPKIINIDLNFISTHKIPAPLSKKVTSKPSSRK